MFCSFAKQHEGQYDWVVKNEGHKGVKVKVVVDMITVIFYLGFSFVLVNILACVVQDGNTW